jgi:uncharacterized DUF497 family protein
MEYEIYFDTYIGMSHIDKHGVSEEEIDEFFNESLIFEQKRDDGSFIAVGKIKSERYLQIIFRKKTKNVYFIITAYDLEDPDIIAMIEESEI